MRRLVSIVMMLLASIMILTHLVVPHHHHCQMLLAVAHLNDDAVDVCDDGVAHTEHHGDEDDDCLMCDVLGGAVLRMLDSDSSHHNIVFAVTASALPNVGPALDSGLLLRLSPYLSRHYDDAVVRTSGLRAPPVC
ncbi:MAG: hypothetical protein J6Z47_04785 [Bacteroidales bacterium]|nr:hypothetical protein [Bacteroidales bacterium]